MTIDSEENIVPRFILERKASHSNLMYNIIIVYNLQIYIDSNL